MKNHTRYFPLLLLSLVVLAGCSATRDLRIPVQVPPQFPMPSHIQTVAIVNRSLPQDDEGVKVMNAIEGILTGESIWEDKKGSMAALDGVGRQLNEDGVVQAIIVDSTALVGTGTGLMPQPLKWAQVEKLCKPHGAQALLVLEVFDTDQQGHMSQNVANQVGSILVNGQPAPVRPASNARIHVKTAWRLYDVTSKTVIDEVRLDDFFGVNVATGNPFYDLGEFRKRDAVQRSGFMAGAQYASRLLPGTIWVYREFYQRPSEPMKRARRAADVNDWDEAMGIWEAEAKNSRRKIARRATYNMAIGWEVKGDLDAAIDWAEAAYKNHGGKRERRYVNILKNRARSGI